MPIGFYCSISGILIVSWNCFRKTLSARLAQLVEHSTDTRKVLGSTPRARTEGFTAHNLQKHAFWRIFLWVQQRGDGMFHIGSCCVRSRVRGGREQRGTRIELTEEEKAATQAAKERRLRNKRLSKVLSGKKSYNKRPRSSEFGVLATLKAAWLASR